MQWRPALNDAGRMAPLFCYHYGDFIMQKDVQTATDDDGKVDAFAAVLLITIIISTVVFWLTNQ